MGKIDLADVVQENQTYTFPIVLASELSNDSGISEATVTISVKGLETKTVETSNIEVINVPEGFTGVGRDSVSAGAGPAAPPTLWKLWMVISSGWWWTSRVRRSGRRSSHSSQRSIWMGRAPVGWSTVQTDIS